MDYLIAFLAGGGTCALVQILMDRTKLQPGHVMVLLVVSGSVLSFLGIYGPWKEFAGAGATVPLTGFGNSLAKGALRGAATNGVIGAFTGGITATAGGIAAAIGFGYLFSLLGRAKTK